MDNVLKRLTRRLNWSDSIFFKMRIFRVRVLSLVISIYICDERTLTIELFFTKMPYYWSKSGKSLRASVTQDNLIEKVKELRRKTGGGLYETVEWLYGLEGK